MRYTRPILLVRTSPSKGPRREARDLFVAMGYKPALVETASLLEHIAAPPAS